jgi:hypothetical protein
VTRDRRQRDACDDREPHCLRPGTTARTCSAWQHARTRRDEQKSATLHADHTAAAATWRNLTTAQVPIGRQYTRAGPQLSPYHPPPMGKAKKQLTNERRARRLGTG